MTTMKSEYGSLEKGGVDTGSRWHSRSHSPSWRRQYHAIPRFLRLFLIAATTFILFRVFVRIHGDIRDTTLKSLPTDFGPLARATGAVLTPPSRAVRRQNTTHIDGRYIYMRELGKGAQGSAALYTDLETGDVVVIKTYQGRGHNPVPDDLAYEMGRVPETWPAEIEAGLLLGDSFVEGRSVYVPVRDYFLIDFKNKQDPWVMVSPYISGGTLENLATSLKSRRKAPQELDVQFRPVFDALLAGLGPLHEANYCHNDIKQDNVFVAAEDHWLLGDLGGVRDFWHPWYWTQKIQRENQWTDCKLNDFRRALKTYMWFLRNACADPSLFDQAFYAGVEGWSKLYWDFMREPSEMAGKWVESRWNIEAEEGGVEVLGATEILVEGSACLQRKVELELTCTALHYQLQDWLPFRRC